jgi:hypothetical protein
MSRALLLFTAGLGMMGATRVVSSPGVARAVFALAAGISSSSDVSDTFSMSMASGAGRTGAGAAWTAALDRARGAMFGMCIQYVPKSFLISKLNYRKTN